MNATSTAPPLLTVRPYPGTHVLYTHPSAYHNPSQNKLPLVFILSETHLQEGYATMVAFIKGQQAIFHFAADSIGHTCYDITMVLQPAFFYRYSWTDIQPHPYGSRRRLLVLNLSSAMRKQVKATSIRRKYYQKPTTTLARIWILSGIRCLLPNQRQPQELLNALQTLSSHSSNKQGRMSEQPRKLLRQPALTTR